MSEPINIGRASTYAIVSDNIPPNLGVGRASTYVITYDNIPPSLGIGRASTYAIVGEIPPLPPAQRKGANASYYSGKLAVLGESLPETDVLSMHFNSIYPIYENELVGMENIPVAVSISSLSKFMLILPASDTLVIGINVEGVEVGTVTWTIGMTEGVMTLTDPSIPSDTTISLVVKTTIPETAYMSITLSCTYD